MSARESSAHALSLQCQQAGRRGLGRRAAAGGGGRGGGAGDGAHGSVGPVALETRPAQHTDSSADAGRRRGRAGGRRTQRGSGAQAGLLQVSLRALE